MTILKEKPPTLSVPLREEPPGVLRVGEGRILLELIIDAYQKGESPDGIIEMYPTLDLCEVYAVIAYYLGHRAEVEEYLLRCDEEAADVRSKIEASQRPKESFTDA